MDRALFVACGRLVACVCLTACSLTSAYDDVVDEVGPVLCSNGVDDDFDDATDCESAACAAFCPPPVAAPALPSLTCIPPWESEPLAGRDGLTHCRVPAEFPDQSSACAALQDLRGLDEYRFVDPTASDGDGSRERPFSSIAEAFDTPSEFGPYDLFLLPGVYREPIVIEGEQAIYAGCDVTLEDDGDPATALIEVRSGRLDLAGVRIHVGAVSGVAPAVAVRVLPRAAFRGTTMVMDGRARLTLDESAFVAISGSHLELLLEGSVCPPAVDPCIETMCAPSLECEPIAGDCIAPCPGRSCDYPLHCDRGSSLCSSLPYLCEHPCPGGTSCRESEGALRCTPPPCMAAISMRTGADLRIVDSRVRTDAASLIESTATDADGVGRVGFERTALTLERGVLARLSGLRTSLSITDCAIRSEGDRTGPLLQVETSSRATIARTEIQLDAGSVLDMRSVSSGPTPWTTAVSMSDVLVHGWHPELAIEPRTVHFQVNTGELEAERVTVLDAPASVFLAVEGGAMSLTDVLVVSATGEEAPMISTTGVGGGGCVTASRLRVEGHAGTALSLSGRCPYSVADVSVLDVRLAGCGAECDRGGTGISVSANASGTLERFEVTRVNGCGLAIDASAALVRRGTVTRSMFGVCVLSSLPGEDVSSVSSGLVLRDNQFDQVVGSAATGTPSCRPDLSVGCGTPFFR